MNERIQELADKSYLTSLTTKGMEDIVDGCYIVSPDKLNEFAELIVRECAAIMHKDTSPNCPYVDYFKVTNKIKQHFGVEE